MRLAALVLVVSSAACSAVTYTITTVAGGTFCGDGRAATSAYLGSPEGLAVDAAGNVYVTDALDHRVRKIDPAGVITTVAGDGYPGFRGDGGPAESAELSSPYGLALDAAGNLYIADLGNGRVRRIAADGTIRTVAGGGAVVADRGDALSLHLGQPRNLAFDAEGNLYISDFGEHRIYRLTAEGVLERVAGTDSAGAIADDELLPAALAPLNAPAGLVFDSSSALYIADSGNGRIRKMQDGMISTVDAGGAPLSLPTGLAFDADGNLFVADKSDAAIWRLTPAPALVAAGFGVPGYSGDGGPAVLAQLTAPREIAFDSAGSLYIADSYPGERSAVGVVRRVSAEGIITTAAGGAGFRPPGDLGPALWGHLDAPSGITTGDGGALYIADRAAHRVRMVKAGIITTVAGTGVPGGAGDGGLATDAQLDQPSGLALAEGRLWIAEIGGSRVRELDSTGVIGRVPLDGLRLPEGIARDGAGNLYIADTENHVVRVARADGSVAILAGNGIQGYAGDGGPAQSAMLDRPAGVAVDAAGAVYIADTGNHAIRKIDASGRISTIAGTGAAGFTGDGAAAVLAELRTPARVAVDAAGNLYVADTGNHRIRKVTPDGMISTIAGTGVAGFRGDGGVALAAELHTPADVAVDAEGHVYIADLGNRRIRKLTPSEGPEPPPVFELYNVVNAASQLPGPVAPGEIVAVTGAGLGPAGRMNGQIGEDGLILTRLEGIEVLFDGVPAPLLSLQYSRIEVQVPYDLPGGASSAIEIRQHGASRARLVLAVADQTPAIFTVGGADGQAAAINQDGTPNSAGHPAARGEIVALYATGEGQTSPAGVTGRTSQPPYPEPAAPVSVTVGGLFAPILFAGGAPGFAGLMQVNVQVPRLAGAGQQPVVLRVGDAASQQGVWIAVK